MAGANTDIRRLLPMLDMAYQAEQLKMAKTMKRIQDLRMQLMALERPKSTKVDTLSAATLAGADLLWEGWVQERKALINREIALAASERERAKADVIKALSKLEAAKRMQARVTQTVRQTADRRSSF